MFGVGRSCVVRVVLVALLAVGGFAIARPGPASAAPAAQSAQLTFRITDAGIEGPDQVPAGLVAITVENATSGPQFIVVARLKAGRTIDELRAVLALPDPQVQEEDPVLPLLDPISGGMVIGAPGARQRQVVTLREGTNVLVSDPEQGAAKIKALQVTAATGPAGPEPTADATVVMRDFAFEMPSQFPAGMQSWKVLNEGQQLHQIFYAKLLPGKTLQDALATPENAPPPVDVTTFGGLSFMSPALTAWIEPDLTPGNWIAVCFVMDPATKKSHAELGMVAGFTVPGAQPQPAPQPQPPAPAPQPPAPLPATSEVGIPLTFPQTGYSLDGDFRSYWEAHGRLPVFGYPISSAQQVNGQVVQWLERARFELHPENTAPYNVLLGHLGVEALQRQGRDWQTFPKAAASAPHYFKETGHAIAHPAFWQYWTSHGLEFDGRRGTSIAESLALFGYPLSEAQLETNANGDRVLTQWFERARFEYHPHNPAASRVLLGRLGAEVRSERGR